MRWGKVLALTAVFFLLAADVLAAPLLKIGSEGHDVRILQQELKAAGYKIEAVTGVFDEATAEAVRRFQEDRGLPVTGTVDRATWHTLRHRLPVPAEKNEAPQEEPARREEKPPEPPSPPAPPVTPAPQRAEEKPARQAEERKPKKEKEQEPAPAVSVPDGVPFLTREEVKAVIATAEKYLGVPYRFGGTTPKGFDCSGFVQFVFRQHGFALPRAADEQYNLGRRLKGRQELERGDLVFFTTYEKGASHCGIYLGANQFIHVSSRRGVRVDRLDDAYWQPRWYGGCHIIK